MSQKRSRKNSLIDRLLFRKLLSSEQYRLVRRIFRENFHQYRSRYLFAIILMVIASAATAGSAWLMEPVVNTVLEAESFYSIAVIGFSIMALFITKGFANYGYTVVLALVRNDLTAKLQKKIYRHMLGLRVEYYDTTTLGEIFTRATNGVMSVSLIIEQTVMSAGRDLLTLIALGAVMFIQEPLISSAVLVVGPVAAIFIRSITRKTRLHSRAQLKDTAASQSLLKEMITGITMVKTYSLEQEINGRMGTVVEGLRKRNDRISKLSARTSPIMEILGGIVIGVLIIYAGWWLSINGTEGLNTDYPGKLMSFITAFLLAYSPAKKLAKLRVTLEKLFVEAQYMYELLDQQDPEVNLFSGKEKIITSRGDVELDQVDFGYKEGLPVLRNVTISGSQGEKVGFVGPSGSGKSTIFKLIMALYKPRSGTIRIDGNNVFEATPECVRRLVSYVGQDSFIYTGTIIENIRFGKLDATEEEIVKAAKLANADGFISRLKDGYETFVGENGAQLSGGQRQRIAIARAFLKDAPIVLLDEATSSLDTESEQAIQSALDGLVKGKTTFIIAHRLSTIQKCDRIYVVANGEIVEQGDHAKLLDDNKIYAQLYKLQFAS